jgi:hypothetical protein
LNGRGNRVRGTVGFDRPARQQQPQDDTQHKLFLFRQVIHGGNLRENAPFGNNPIICDLRPSPDAAECTL